VNAGRGRRAAYHAIPTDAAPSEHDVSERVYGSGFEGIEVNGGEVRVDCVPQGSTNKRLLLDGYFAPVGVGSPAGLVGETFIFRDDSGEWGPVVLAPTESDDGVCSGGNIFELGCPRRPPSSNLVKNTTAPAGKLKEYTTAVRKS